MGERGDRVREGVWALALGALGVGVRWAFIRRFPTHPFSDFAALIRFGFHLHDRGLAAPTPLWQLFNSGFPMVVALLRAMRPDASFGTVRAATAVATGLVPLLPYVIWRGVVSLRLRVTAGLLLALWPGQVFFSGVTAQDNWVLPPMVALACLATRALLEEKGAGHPIAAGLLWALAVAIRQEMLVVLVPLALAAAMGRRREARGRALGLLALSAGIPMLALCAQRGLATGRFALTTEHGGLAVLGTVVPGAFEPGWIDPKPFAASADPDLFRTSGTATSGTLALAWREVRRRPAFHAARIGTQTLRLGLRADALNLFWSLRAPQALDPGRQAAGEAFARRWTPWLDLELALIQGLFAAAIAVGFGKRDPAVLVLGGAVLLKVGIQAVLSPMSRLLLPATALELLAIALALRHLPALSPGRRAALALLVLAVPAFLAVVVPRLEVLVTRWDRETALSSLLQGPAYGETARGAPLFGSSALPAAGS